MSLQRRPIAHCVGLHVEHKWQTQMFFILRCVSLQFAQSVPNVVRMALPVQTLAMLSFSYRSHMQTSGPSRPHIATAIRRSLSTMPPLGALHQEHPVIRQLCVAFLCPVQSRNPFRRYGRPLFPNIRLPNL